MKRIRMLQPIRLLLMLVLSISMVAACAEQGQAEFDAGIDYAVLPHPVPTHVAPGKVQVVEMFWYGCPHCFHFEPFIQKWLANKPEAAEFVRVPAALNSNWIADARAYYAAESLGVVDKLHEPLFNAIHEQHRRINSEDALARFAASQGIDEAAFRKAMNSFYVNTKLRQSVDLAQQYMVDGVPMIIVNGKYKVTGAMAGSYGRMIEITNYLVAKEAAQ
jgi:protein dithiol oxidoreductase (disulfide-forming)